MNIPAIDALAREACEIATRAAVVFLKASGVTEMPDPATLGDLLKEELGKVLPRALGEALTGFVVHGSDLATATFAARAAAAGVAAAIELMRLAPPTGGMVH